MHTESILELRTTVALSS